MSETSVTDPLIQRLVVQRLAAPGILDRRTLQRAHDRFIQPAGAHVVSQLQRRMAPAVTSTESLPLVRIDRSVDEGDPSPLSGNGSSASVARGGDEGSATRPSMNHLIAGSFAGVRLARQTPAISRVGEPVGNRAGDVPGSAVDVRATTRPWAVSENVKAPAIAVSAAPRSVVQRAAASLADSPATPDATPVAMTMRSQSGRTEADAPRAAAFGEPAIVTRPLLAFVASAPLSSVLASTTASSRGAPVNNIAGAAAPLLLRKADSAKPSPRASGLRVTSPLSASVTAAPMPLLMRQTEAGAAPPPAETPLLWTAGSAVSSAQTTASPHLNATESAGTHPNEPSIDWIAEQVGNRLARRLEIERERRGVRQWRQVS
jgi:hypothetical protein